MSSSALPTPAFDQSALLSLLKQILPVRLRGVRWSHTDKSQNRDLSRDIAQLAKSKLLGMFPAWLACICTTLTLCLAVWLEIQPTGAFIANRGRERSDTLTVAMATGFKYIVQVQLVENLGQGGRGQYCIFFMQDNRQLIWCFYLQPTWRVTGRTRTLSCKTRTRQ